MQLSAGRVIARRLVAVRPSNGRLVAVRVSAQQAAKAGDFVSVHYTGTLDDGSVFDTSRKEGRTPLEFQIGGGLVIKGFDTAVTGLAVGQSNKVRVAPEDAYGQVNAEYIINIPKAKAPEGLKVNDRVMLSNGLPARVTVVGESEVTLDLNHELAGKHLTFDVELLTLTAQDSLQKATFGAGCFWGPELAFQRVPGVISTEVGYSQGKVEEPSYEQVCSGSTGHAEVVQVTYDSQQVTYRELLDVFWGKHDPTSLNKQGADVGTQYRAGIYTHSDEQAEQAAKYLEEKRAAMPGVKIVTELEPIKSYYKAEPYHQQYLSRGGRFNQPQDASKGCNDPIRCYG
ncbi:hypothetical protein OEZ86_003952 [Tetradesmus obliquus]|nr:hypothetical protein OEZ86_003952 [Tetradesmus obliquus]